jgi:hypothetical protein
LVVYRFFVPKARKINLHWREAMWLWPYFIGLSLISYLGNFGDGREVIPFGWDFAVIAVFSILVMWLAMHFRLSSATTRQHLENEKIT